MAQILKMHIEPWSYMTEHSDQLRSIQINANQEVIKTIDDGEEYKSELVEM